MLQTILLVIMILISVSLAGVILLQRSEGGALGMGGGPSGFMTARGAGNLLTRSTAILATAFFVCAIALTIAGNVERSNRSIVDPDAVGALAAPAQGATNPAAAAADQPATPAQPKSATLEDLESSIGGAQPTTAPAQPAPAN